MAKIGQLILQRGQWQGQQLVSEGWIEQSTQYLSQYDAERHYGYLWWLRRARLMTEGGVPFIAAEGNGGQYIFIVPSYDLVVVFTGRNYDRDQSVPFRVLDSVILPAFSPD